MPAEETIVALLRTGREATEIEVEAILQEIASASLPTREKRVPPRYRGTYLGNNIASRAPSDIAHLVQRVKEEQWADGTTIEQYAVRGRSEVRCTLSSSTTGHLY